MSLLEEFEQEIDGKCILLDTSVVTPCEKEPLADILYDGIKGLETLDPALLSHRVSRLIELTRLMQFHNVIAIPQVCSEIEKHFKILNRQHVLLRSELKESRQEKAHIDTEYYANIIDVFNAHNFSLYQFLKRLRKKSSISYIEAQGARYTYFFNTARSFSRDFVEKSHREKAHLQYPAYLGEELETDQHLAATLLMSSYERPTILFTRDSGLDKLTQRLYKFVEQYGAPTQNKGRRTGIPQYLPEVCNTKEYDQQELAQFQQEAREFLSNIDGVDMRGRYSNTSGVDMRGRYES